jgi:hypothetical protein
MQGERDGILIGTGAALMLIVLLVLQSFTGSGVFGAKTATTTFTSTQEATGLVSGLYAEHILLLDSRNISAIVDEYEGNATIVRASEAQCECNSLDGTYTGTANITQLMKQLLFGVDANGFSFGTKSFVAENLTESAAAAPDGSVTVNSTFGFLEQSIAAGKINGTVSAGDSYTYSAASHSWLISRETWDFLSYSVQNPAISGY